MQEKKTCWEQFYAMTVHGQRSIDWVHTVYSRTADRAKSFSKEWDIPNWETAYY